MERLEIVIRGLEGATRIDRALLQHLAQNSDPSVEWVILTASQAKAMVEILRLAREQSVTETLDLVATALECRMDTRLGRVIASSVVS